jgi:hypothetical protein
MRGFSSFLILALCCGTLPAQQSKPDSVPQTARQALIEMFFGKSEGTLVKHLPAATRAALEKSGALASMQQYSTMAHSIQTQGKTLQTFETGSILLTSEDAKTGQKFEVTVENDSLQGDQDDLELTFQTYKDNEPKRTPFMPHLTFSMKMEDGTWKLNEISLALHLPLADPDFLKAITEKMKPAPITITAQPAIHGTIETNNEQPSTLARGGGNESMVLAAMESILTAEAIYQSTYRAVGYTCTISNLDGFGGGEPNEHQAMLINSGLASGHKYGYVFSLSGCGATPAKTFVLTATPGAHLYGQRAYCSDQNGAIKYSDDGNAAACQSSGTRIP